MTGKLKTGKKEQRIEPIKKKTRRGGGLATIHDVADRAGVSIKTVSRVVNQEPNVSPEMMQKVQQVIFELNYRPNFSARNLAGSRAYLIALVYDNPSDNYLVSLQEGALYASQQLGYSLLLHPVRFDSLRLIDDMMALVRERRPTGLILTPPLSDMAGLLDALDRNEIDYARVSPLDRARLGSVVTIDDQRASYDLTSYLIAQGHRRIGFIKGHPAHAAASQRLDGFLNAHRQLGLPVDQSLITQGLFSFDSGMECGRVLLMQGDPPTAIFASNDDMAAGVLYTAHELGLRVPEELSVAGFDDTPLSRHVWPSLTTIRQPIRTMGELAVRSLIAAVRDRTDNSSNNPNVSLVQHELIIRASTAKAADVGRRVGR